jgi:hypothetical protein
LAKPLVQRGLAGRRLEVRRDRRARTISPKGMVKTPGDAERDEAGANQRHRPGDLSHVFPL